ncbi:MAG: hypothetical protein IRY89_16140 [Pseudolabrys sp.]|nr:hypothetical protein [Pseudolabrys sp.]
MNLHKKARLTPIGRERIVRLAENGQPPKTVAEAAGGCPQTVRKRVDRYRRDHHARPRSVSKSMRNRFASWGRKANRCAR